MLINELIENPIITLLKLEYKAVPCPTGVFDGDSDFSIEIRDEFECKTISEVNHLAVKFQRAAFFNPSQLFNIEICFQIDWEIVDGRLKDVEEKIKNLDLGERNFMCYSAQAEAAMLIAQMTQSNSMLPPLWTPNNIIEEKEDH